MLTANFSIRRDRQNKLAPFAIRRRLLLFFRHFLLFAVVVENKYKGAFRYSPQLFSDRHVLVFNKHRILYELLLTSGVLNVISSFFLQDIPRHDTCLFEVRKAFERTLLLGFHAYISAYIVKKTSQAAFPGAPPGPPAGGLRARVICHAQNALRRVLRSPQQPPDH